MLKIMTIQIKKYNPLINNFNCLFKKKFRAHFLIKKIVLFFKTTNFMTHVLFCVTVIRKENTLVCQFASPLDHDMHNKPEVIELKP